MIVIIDYRMGNLRSVQKAFERLGFEARISGDPRDIGRADKLVLPGVGAFGDAMRNMEEMGLLHPLREAVAGGKPLLGICLGIQLLFSQSEEMGIHRGLDLLPGRVRRFPPGLKVPHIGWNQVWPKRECPLLEGIPRGSFFYFVHSYYVQPRDEGVVVATTDYGIDFVSVVAWDNIFGIQFHPEKSQELGLRVLRNFGEL